MRAFKSGLFPKNKPGRRPKEQITAAYLDWTAGIRGVQLYQKHIPKWEQKSRWRRKAEQRVLLDAICSRARRERERLRVRSGPER